MNPILFQWGDLSLHSFGVMVALGFLAGLWVAARNARQVGLPDDVVYDLAPWLVIGGLVGARALYVISYWNRDFAGRPPLEIFAVWKGGLVFYGGLIVATIAGVWRLRRLGLPVWTLTDCLAPGIVIGHAFGRIGCLLNGCCYGRPFNSPWSIQFPKDHITCGIPVHPAQLYEAGSNLLFFALLMTAFHRRKFAGQVFCIYLIGYAVLRSTVEVFRGDYEPAPASAITRLTPGQTTSLLILCAGVVLFQVLRSRPQASPRPS